jgi:hypothetical protein
MGKVKNELEAYGKIEELDQRDDIKKQPAIADLASQTASDMVAKVNAILASLRSAGVIASS